MNSFVNILSSVNKMDRPNVRKYAGLVRGDIQSVSFLYVEMAAEDICSTMKQQCCVKEVQFKGRL